MTTGKKQNKSKRDGQVGARKQGKQAPKLQGTAQREAEKLGCYGPSYRALELLNVLHEYGAFNAADAHPARLLGEFLGLCPEHLLELAQSIQCSHFAVVAVTTGEGDEEELDGLFIETNPESVAALFAWRIDRGALAGEAAREAAGSRLGGAASKATAHGQAVSAGKGVALGEKAVAGA